MNNVEKLENYRLRMKIQSLELQMEMALKLKDVEIKQLRSDLATASAALAMNNLLKTA